MAARNIVLIVHYFSPLNVAGAKRMDAMAKYFAKLGRNVTVITTNKTAADGGGAEPYPAGVKVITIGRNGRAVEQAIPVPSPELSPAGGWAGRLKGHIFRLFGQLPDPRLIFSLRLGLGAVDPLAKSAIAEADVLVASCPPWPVLLAGVMLGRKYRKPIVLDYRDQFSACHEMPGSRLAKYFETVIDRWLARRADEVTTVSRPMAKYYGAWQSRTKVITNGYDSDRVAAARATAAWRPRQNITVRYFGLITPGRVPHALLAAMTRLSEAGELPPNIAFEFYGDCDVLREAIDRNYRTVAGRFAFKPSVGYQDSLSMQAGSDYLLFCENSIPALRSEALSAAGILTTKLFEYLASGRPIIADLPKDTTIADYITRGSARHFVSNSAEEFVELLTSPAFGQPAAVPTNAFVHSLSREALAHDYLDLLDAVVERPQNVSRVR